MTFHVGIYRNGKADLIKHIARNRGDVSKLSFYCASVGFPVAAAVVFCMEEFPEKSEELLRKLEVLKEFYGYTEVIE